MAKRRLWCFFCVSLRGLIFSEMKKGLFALLLAVVAMAVWSCSRKPHAHLTVAQLPDTLIVGTLYSPTSYFYYKEDTMGYEYERVCNFAEEKGIATRFVVANNMDAMIAMLDSGIVDVIAYEVPITAEFRERVLSCGTENITHQILVQPRSDTMITDVTQLVGRDVYVEKNSKYEARLRNLDDEVGGGIKIHTIDEDSLITDDLVEMVAEGKLPLTVVDSDIARLNRTYYSNIDISLEVSFPQRAAWAVKKGNQWLADSITQWSKGEQQRPAYKLLLKRYFELSKMGFTEADDVMTVAMVSENLRKGFISQYDDLFRHHAALIGWDWRILAAQAWVESKFNNDVVSWAGARGLMQLMPRTAKAYGLTQEEITDPDKNIGAAVQSIRDLDRSLSKYVADPAERLNFIIAAYNSGIGHIYDAMALARKYGKNPAVWYGNVEEAVLWKSNPEFYNDEVCRFGYFRGRQTVNYVREVNRYYALYKSHIAK